jgi:hypothetical protein
MPAHDHQTWAHHLAKSPESDKEQNPEQSSPRMEQLRAEIQRAMQAAVQVLREELLHTEVSNHGPDHHHQVHSDLDHKIYLRPCNGPVF